MPTKSKTVWALLLAGGISAAIACLPNQITSSIQSDWKTSNPPLTNREPCQGIAGGPYPSRVPTSVLLPNSDHNVRIGYDCYVDQVKVETRLEYKNGMREFIRYRPDRTVSERTKHWSTVNGDLGIVQSHATYAADGVTFTAHEVYRGDGTLERIGVSDRDGSYTARFFFEDGISVERLRRFNKLKEFVSETQYRRDGSELAVIVVAMDGLELGVTLYAPDGKKTAIFYRTKMGEKGYVYAEDGFTVLLEYANDRYYKVAGYSDHNGRLLQKWESRFNRRVIAFLSQDETRTYTQIWREGEAPALRKVEEHNFVTKELVRVIDMSKDGSKVDTVTVVQSDGIRVISRLDDNGKVVQIDRFSVDGKQLSTTKPAAPQTADIPVEALSEPKTLVSPPGFRLYGPPLLYDWE